MDQWERAHASRIQTVRLFAPLVTETRTLLETYDDQQLALIADFLERLNAANQRLIGLSQAGTSSAPPA